MPKRTNDFQKLVLLMQQHLAAREGWSVQESRMLVDRVTGDEREVDIVVEGRINGVPFLIGLECQAKKRRSDLPWVQYQSKKHERLTNKLVLVSKAPFTKSALREATLSGVETVSFADAVNVNWSAYIDQYTQLTLATFDLMLKEHSVDLQVGHDGAAPDPDQSAAVVINGSAPVPYLQALHSIVRQPRVGRSIMDQWYAMPPAERKDSYDVNLTITARPDDQWLLQQGADRAWQITEVRGRVGVAVAAAELPMSPTQFLHHRMLHGTGVLPAGRRIQLLLTERKGERPQATLVLGAHGAEGEQVTAVDVIVGAAESEAGPLAT